MNFNFENIKFVTNWASASTLVGLVVAVIYFFIENKNLKATITDSNTKYTEIKTEYDQMKLDNAKLEGKVDGINQAAKLIMDHSPEFLEHRIAELERYHPRNYNNARVDTTHVMTRAPRL